MLIVAELRAFLNYDISIDVYYKEISLPSRLFPSIFSTENCTYFCFPHSCYMSFDFILFDLIAFKFVYTNQ
jgi:hypothetical protein